MIKSPIIPTEILQRPKKKNIIFKKIAISRSISAPAVTPASTFTIKTTTKTMKPIR